ncbi:MAG: SDR family oxidoreductase [Pyrinomonadaceae bacterium]
MKIAIFGATGGTGRELVRQALEQNHEVTVFARTPSKINDLQHENLKIVQGDVLNFDGVEKAVVGQEAVLSALGSPTLKAGDTTLSDGTKNIIKAMEKHGIQRFICETSLGIGDSYGQPGFFFTKIVVPFLLKHAFADKEIQERDIKTSKLDWIIVRPGRLTNSEKTGKYRHGLDKSISGKISRADVADFMLKQLTDEQYLRKTPAICY